MAIRRVVRLGHPVLRAVASKCGKVDLESPEVQRLIDEMVETMRDYGGVGIAASQVGVPLRIFAMEIRVDNFKHPGPAEFPLEIHVNPEVLIEGERSVMSPEGCLSVPGLRGVAARYPALTLKSTDRFGNFVERRLEGLPAIIVQHEVDHLNGHVYLDFLWSPAALGYEEEAARYLSLSKEYLEKIPSVDVQASIG
ncbi:MAG: peptide deformylase [Pseudonocardiaceae bacterium]